MSQAQAIINLDQAESTVRGNGKSFESRHARLGSEIGLQKLTCSLYVVPPGKSAFPFHAHSNLEEMCIVLEGNGTVRQDDEELPVRAGDIIAWPVGVAHRLINTSDEDLRYLVVSNNDIVDVVTYPDSDKVLAYSEAYGKPMFHITRRDAAVDYYDGEDD